MRHGVLALAVAQIVVPLFVNPFRDGHSRVLAGEPSLIQPAGYAFSIWGLIYLASLAYAVWQLMASGRADPMTRRAAPLAAATFGGSALWLVAAEYGPLWSTMPILAAIAACAVVVLVMAVRAPGGSAARRWLMIAPFGLYAGWALCAAFVNIAEVAPQLGFDRLGLSIPTFGIATIAVTSAIALGVLLLSRGNPVFALTVAWALVAIVVAAVQRDAPRAIHWTSGIAAALLLIASLATMAVTRRS